MTDSSIHDLIDELLDEFLNRRLDGESPSISDYCHRYPHLADQIRKLFGTLATLENIKPAANHRPGATPKHPATIADYHIERIIGRGGMGLVYEALHKTLGRRVALKVMHRRIAEDENAIARFQREARAVAKLHHTNIVPLFEVGEDDGRCYLAMQLIPGMSLDQLIAERADADSNACKPWSEPLPWSADKPVKDRIDALGTGTNREAFRGTDSALTRHFRWIARIGMQVAEALAYAHDRGVIHRDIKPSNLLLENSGVLWLTDFGLAKTEDDALTQTGEFVGTLRYMAPEQLGGDFDHRADVYALGVTLYELLALRPAFAASDSIQLLDAIHNADPPRLRDLNPRVPRDLETIVMKAMDREPASRYQSAQLMADDLERFVNDEPIRARRLSAAERLLRWQRRNRGLAVALSVTAMLLMMLIGVLSWTSIRQAELRKLSDQGREQLKQNLYLSQMNVAGQALVQRFGTDTIQARLAEWTPGAGSRDLRNWEWYYLHAMSHRAAFVSEPLGNGFCWACDHSPDGKCIVNTVNAWGIQVRDAEHGEVLRERQLGSARFVAWSPDGNKIAVGQFGDICNVVDAETLETLCELQIPAGEETTFLSWHPESRWLAEVSESKIDERTTEIRLHDTENGELIWTIGSETHVRTLCWHPDGARITCAVDQLTKTWRVADGKPQLESQTPGSQAAWSPDGSMLAVARDTGIWDAEKERLLARDFGLFCWGPHSKQFAVGGHDGAIRVYDLDSPMPRRRLLGHASMISSVSWSNNGAGLASTGLHDETVRVWNLSELDNNQQIAGDPGAHAVRLSADGRRIAASASYGHTLFLWDISGKKLAQRYLPELAAIRAINADGSQVAFLNSSGKLAIWHTVDESVATVSIADTPSRFMESVAWHADGRLAVGTAAGNLCVSNEVGNQVVAIEDAHDGQVVEVEWHEDSDQLATLGIDGKIKVWSGSSGELRGEWTPAQGVPGEICLSSGGEMLAGSYPSAVVLWETASGRQISQFDEVRERFLSLAWSPDDSRIVTSSTAAISVWDVSSGRIALRIEAPPESQNVRWSPDGMHILVGCTGGIRIYDATRGYAWNSANRPDGPNNRATTSQGPRR